MENKYLNKSNIGLIFSGLIIVVIGITMLTIYNTITSIELTEEQIQSITFVDFAANIFFIPSIALPIATIVGWRRIQKVWFKNMPWLIIGGSVILGIIGLVLKSCI